MGLTIKNSNNFWGSLKNPIFRGRGGGSLKAIIERGLPKKGRIGQFADLRMWGDLARKRGMVFLKGVDTPMHIM